MKRRLLGVASIGILFASSSFTAGKLEAGHMTSSEIMSSIGSQGGVSVEAENSARGFLTHIAFAEAIHYVGHAFYEAGTNAYAQAQEYANYYGQWWSAQSQQHEVPIPLPTVFRSAAHPIETVFD